MIFQFGIILKNLRERMGITQEALCRGICSVPTLSRIESGERLPTKLHLEALLQRLGCTDMIFAGFVDKTAFHIYALKNSIRRESTFKRYEQARKLLQELQELLTAPDSLDRQFLLLHTTLLYEEDYSEGQRLARFEEALRLTCPQYREQIFPGLLSYEEIVLLNNVSVLYAERGQTDYALETLYFLKQFYEKQIVNSEEAQRLQPMILCSLSHVLRLAGRYDECIEICLSGIWQVKESGRCMELAQFLFNCAYAYLLRDASGDRDAALAYARQAFYTASIMEDQSSAKQYHDFLLEHFGEDLSL